jgi:hypothetical protein
MTTMLLAAGASATRHSAHTLFYALLPIAVLAVVFDVYCLTDLVRAEAVRHLPKAVWAVIIVVISAPWGGLIYLFVGRDRNKSSTAPR